MKYRRLLAAVAATPWAIEPNKGRELAGILSRRAAGKKATTEELALAAGARAERQDRQRRPQPRPMAIVPLHGVMAQRADLFMEVSGLLSTEQIGRLVDLAADDPGYESIVIDIDSPGGSVFGTPELAAKVAAAAKRKKVIAVVNSLCASAAYYVASQASEIVMTPGGMCGSIGVVMMHIDESKALENAGQVVTVIASSDTKRGGVDPGPLSEAWRVQLEGIIAGYYADFVRTVAKGRKTSVQRVKEDFGDGGVLLAQEAVRVGMVDRVGTLDDVLAEHGLKFSVDGEHIVAIAGVKQNLKPTAGRPAAAPAPTASVDYDVEIRRRQLLLDEPPRARQSAPVAPVAPAAAPVKPVHPPLTEAGFFAAFHEAGHALVAVALGSREVTASIVPDAVSGGHVAYDRAGMHFLAHGAVAYAGALTERLCPLATGWTVPGYSRGDHEILTGCPRELWPAAEAKAQELIDANPDIIRDLAKLLCERRELSDSDIRAVVFGR